MLQTNHRFPQSVFTMMEKAPARRLNSVLNVKALESAFNQEKALVGAFSVIVKKLVLTNS